MNESLRYNGGIINPFHPTDLNIPQLYPSDSVNLLLDYFIEVTRSWVGVLEGIKWRGIFGMGYIQVSGVQGVGYTPLYPSDSIILHLDYFI